VSLVRADAEDRSAQVDVPQHQPDPGERRAHPATCSKASAPPPCLSRGETPLSERAGHKHRMRSSTHLHYHD
jgi:hypothetical protein